MSGSVKPAQIRGDGVHGYGDRCPRCGPLRVLPEGAEEMRRRAATAKARSEAAEPDPWAREWHGYTDTLAADVLRCLDEIAKLTRECDEAQTALTEAREHVMALRMELADRQMEAEERAPLPAGHIECCGCGERRAEDGAKNAGWQWVTQYDGEPRGICGNCRRVCE